MSKRAKGKAPSTSATPTPEPGYDRTKFVSEKAWKWFNNELNKKAFVQEKGIKMVEGWDYNIQQNVYDRDWEKLVAVPSPAVYDLVKEFYANLVDPRGGKCWVRGKWVNFSAKSINSFYGTPSFPEDEWSIYADTEVVDVDLITRTICYGDVVWEMTRSGAYKQFKIGLLTEVAKVWYSFVMSSLDPGKHVSHVTLDRAKLVFAIISGKSIDVGRLLNSKFRQTAETTGTGIWFPSLVTGLCRDAGVSIGVEEYVMKPLQPIERVSHTRFQTRLSGDSGKKMRVERKYSRPSPPHGTPGVAHQAPSSSSARQPSHVSIDDRLAAIQAHQERQEEFMKYQYDWQQQLQNSMINLSLEHAVPEEAIPIFPTLRPDFFPAAPTFEEELDDSSIFDGAGGWSPYLPASPVPAPGTSSYWGSMPTSPPPAPDDSHMED